LRNDSLRQEKSLRELLSWGREGAFYILAAIIILYHTLSEQTMSVESDMCISHLQTSSCCRFSEEMITGRGPMFCRNIGG
jgi:hypothetical protein